MKILTLDLETSPMMAFVWKLWRENVGLNQLIQNSVVIGFAAKWRDSDEIIYADARGRKNRENDKHLIKKIAKLVDEADLVVAQNGRDFDLRVLQARMMNYDMDPPSSYKTIDTKLVAQKHFRLPSYKLEYMADKFNKKYKKLKHNKFPGFELWVETFMNDNPKAWDEMEKYNKHDVLATEELYFERFIKWDTHINFFNYQSDQSVCVCGSNHWKKRGFHYTKTAQYQRYKCLSCGREFRSTKSFNRTRLTTTTRN